MSIDQWMNEVRTALTAPAPAPAMDMEAATRAIEDNAMLLASQYAHGAKPYLAALLIAYD